MKAMQQVPPTSIRGVGVFAHFANGTERIDGQIHRSRLVLQQIKKRLADTVVRSVDTGHILRRPFSTLFEIWRTTAECSDIIVMPNTRGVKWLLPIYLSRKKSKGFKVHFLVVGGWLPRYLSDRPQDVARLKECSGVYVQTQRMFDELSKLGLKNLSLLPNFRDFSLTRKRSGEIGRPLKLVYLSRILPEKGPQLAIRAVDEINEKAGQKRTTLDLWGPVQSGYEDWFERTIESASESIRYRGVLKPERIPVELTNYDAMVFPTYYSGEAFPGAILDAQISGLPIIASDWQDNAEFVEVGVSGLLFKSRNLDDLKEKIVWMLENPRKVMDMKQNAFLMADRFHVDNVFPALLEDMGLLEP